MSDEPYVVLISGPISTHRQAEDTVRARGLTVIDHDPRQHTFGYPATVEGDDDRTVGFIPVRAAHPDDLADLVRSDDEGTGQLAALGWTQRGYWPEPPSAPPIEVVPAGPLERLQRIEQALTARGVI